MTSPLVGPMIHLGTLDPFRDLPRRQLTALALSLEEVLYQTDQWLARPGEPVHSMLAIVDGFATLRGSNGEETSLGPGGLVGFPEVLVPDTAPVAVRAQTDLMALRLGTDELRDLCEQHFAILAGLLTYLAGRVASDPRALTSLSTGAEPSTPAEPPSVEDRIGRLIVLHRAPLLPSHSMDALAELAGRVAHVAVPAGGALWEEGDAPDGFFVIASGSIDWTDAAGGRTAIGPGGVAGLAESLAGVALGGRAVATRPTTLLHVPLDPFMDVLEDHFELAYSLLGGIARHLIVAP